MAERKRFYHKNITREVFGKLTTYEIELDRENTDYIRVYRVEISDNGARYTDVEGLEMLYTLIAAGRDFIRSKAWRKTYRKAKADAYNTYQAQAAVSA